MVNYFIYAKDYSGSTHNVDYYHSHGIETLKQFKSDVEKIISELPCIEEFQIFYLQWGLNCILVSEKTTLERYEQRRGVGSEALPEKIIEWIGENIGYNEKIKLLYIITDGLIKNRSVKKCLKLNETIDYENIVFHGINKDTRNINMSIVASFLKGQCAIYRNNELLDKINISKQSDYNNITIENFPNEKENLMSYIKYKFINSCKNNPTALREIEKLKSLKKRLFNNMSKKRSANLDTTDKETFILEFKNTNWYENLIEPTLSLNKNIEQTISNMINYITIDKRSYAFDDLKFETKYSEEVCEEKIFNVDFSPDQEIEFPNITLDDEKGIPVILLTEFNLLEKIFFQNGESPASFSKLSSTMECPLFLLNNPNFIDSIGNFYTLDAYKQLLEKTQWTEPHTCKPFRGGIVLVDTDDYDRYNDYVLSASYFNYKKIKYNVGLFYFVIWKICEKKEWMDNNVVERLKKYIYKRISYTMCRIGLSSLSSDPPITTPLPTALWYCVELSSYIFKDDPNNFMHERLRKFFDIASYMIEILKYFNYSLDLEFINNRINLIRHVSNLKKIPTKREKNLYLIEKIFKSLDGFLVCEIEDFSKLYILNYLKLNHKEMYRDDVLAEEIDLHNFVHFIYHIDDSSVQICDTTYRPFFMIDKNTSFYSVLYKKAKKIVFNKEGGRIMLTNEAIDKIDFSSILSYYNLFSNYVKECSQYPSLDEYKEYILKHRKFMDDLVTIFPLNVHEGIERAHQSYENISKNVSVSGFLKVNMKYVDQVNRIKAENRRIFNSDEEIKDFISKEVRRQK